MVQINFAQKQVNAKIVYYGPGMSGKTTNLEVIHQRAPEGNRGDLTSISTEGDRTLFFDFMPLDLGTVAGMRTCFQIYTVPGQVYYNSTRKLVLQGVDGVIFVADSSPHMMEENLQSLRNLAENLEEYGRSAEDMPIVIQYNKRDIPGALSIDELEEQLNPDGAPAFEAIANTGQGVFPTLKAVAAAVLDSLHRQQTAAAGNTLPANEAQPARSSASTAPDSAPAAPASTDTNSAEPEPKAVPMSQTGFYKTPSTPLPAAGAAASAKPSAAIPNSEPEPEPAKTPELRIAAPLSLHKANAEAMPSAPAPRQKAPVPTPLPAAQPDAVAAKAAVQTMQRPEPAPSRTPAAPKLVNMGVQEGAQAPSRRAPASQSFSTAGFPRATPKGQGKQSVIVTGLIIVASIVLGALLGSYVLSIL